MAWLHCYCTRCTLIYVCKIYVCKKLMDSLSIGLLHFSVAWDSEDIDHWHIDKFTEGDMAQPLTEESSFATLFPKYREKYLQKVWPHVTRLLKSKVIFIVIDIPRMCMQSVCCSVLMRLHGDGDSTCFKCAVD